MKNKSKFFMIIFCCICIICMLCIVYAYGGKSTYTVNGYKIKDIDTSFRIEDNKMVVGTDEVLYKGFNKEKYSYTGALWGCSKDNLVENFNSIGYEKLESNNEKTLSYIIGMLAEGWNTNFEFNDYDELFRIDMNPKYRFTDETVYKNLVKLCFKGLNDRYGDYRVTLDYNNFISNIEWDDIWDTFLEERTISIIFEKYNIRTMLVLTLDTDEENVNIYDVYLGTVNTAYPSIQSTNIVIEEDEETIVN